MSREIKGAAIKRPDYNSDTAEDEPINILIVDDRPENLLVLEAVLHSPEFNLVKARSGKEALGYLLRQDFALILLDVQMPDLDGYETARMIRKREKSRGIPIIFVTAVNKDFQHVALG